MSWVSKKENSSQKSTYKHNYQAGAKVFREPGKRQIVLFKMSHLMSPLKVEAPGRGAMRSLTKLADFDLRRLQKKKIKCCH
jgi:hypothetical protein